MRATITHVTVTAPEGRLTPVHPDDGLDVNGRLFIDSDTVARVRWSPATRRSVNRGDLVLCKQDGTKVNTPLEASAPNDIGHPIRGKKQKGVKQ